MRGPHRGDVAHTRALSAQPGIVAWREFRVFSRERKSWLKNVSTARRSAPRSGLAQSRSAARPRRKRPSNWSQSPKAKPSCTFSWTASSRAQPARYSGGLESIFLSPIFLFLLPLCAVPYPLVRFPPRPPPDRGEQDRGRNSPPASTTAQSNGDMRKHSGDGRLPRAGRRQRRHTRVPPARQHSRVARHAYRTVTSPPGRSPPGRHAAA